MGQRLGQHFLKNKSVLKRIVDTLELRDGDVVIEIGPGHGELTREIVDRAQGLGIRVIGIEKDRKLAESVRWSVISPNIEIIQGDVLKVLPRLTDHLPLSTGHYKLVGNIPYYITGHLLRIIGELEHKPTKTVLLVQKEVAQRICAKPPRSNLLSLSVQFWAEPKIIKDVPKEYFSPPPRVDSAIILLNTRTNADYTLTDADKNELPSRASADYYSFIRKAFKHPRKTLANNLVAAGYKKEEVLEKITDAGLRPDSRPESLSREVVIKYFCCP